MKVAFFDIDGTLVADFSGISFLSLLSEKGVFQKNNKDRLLETTKQYKLGNVSYEQFTEIFEKEICAGLKGQKQTEISNLTDEFWQLIQPKFAVWARDLIALFNNNGYKTIAVSGSPIELLNLYKKKLGFQDVFATTLEINNGIYTGNIVLNLILSKEKEMIVDTVIAKDDVDLKNSYGFGDNEHDRAFLDKVGHPIAIASESSLKHYAKKQGWPVLNFNDNVLEGIKSLFDK